MPLLQNSDGSYGGWEYSIITALAHNLNFRLDIRPPADGERWGRNVNGTFTGTIYLELQTIHPFS